MKNKFIKFYSIMLRVQQKGVKDMNSKDFKVKAAKLLAHASLKVGNISVNSSCAYIFHQPKVPDELKKLKKN